MKPICCEVSKCKHYLSSGCMLQYEEQIYINTEGKCNSFETGEHEAYQTIGTSYIIYGECRRCGRVGDINSGSHLCTPCEYVGEGEEN